MTCPSDRGSSLVEVLTATLVFTVSVAALVPLVTGSVRAARAARDTGQASWVAWQKLEELRSVTFADLAPSPPSSLETDTSGFVDYLSERGEPSDARGVYVRRWLVAPSASDDGEVMRLAVAVHHVAAPGVAVTLATLRMRRTP